MDIENNLCAAVFTHHLVTWPFCVVSSAAHTPDNSFLGFVSEEAVREDAREEELEADAHRKDKIAVVYGKQDYMWKVQWPICLFKYMKAFFSYVKKLRVTLFSYVDILVHM